MAYIDKAKSNKWATPRWLFELLNEEFDFTVDVAADESNHLCDRYYSEVNDGLIQNWGGERVFCNPPYNKLDAWIRKAHSEKENAECIVMLIPVRTSTKAFHDCINHQAEIRFFKGRLRFGDGSSDNAPFDSMVVIFRKSNRWTTYM